LFLESEPISQDLKPQPQSGAKKVAHSETVGFDYLKILKPRLGRQKISAIFLSPQPWLCSFFGF
jgi:hypothetical protein